jgi:hypothetical protein
MFKTLFLLKPARGGLPASLRPLLIAEGFQQLFESGRHYCAFAAKRRAEPVTDFHYNFLAVPVIEIDRRHSLPPPEHPATRKNADLALLVHAGLADLTGEQGMCDAL